MKSKWEFRKDLSNDSRHSLGGENRSFNNNQKKNNQAFLTFSFLLGMSTLFLFELLLTHGLFGNFFLEVIE